MFLLALRFPWENIALSVAKHCAFRGTALRNVFGEPHRGCFRENLVPSLGRLWKNYYLCNQISARENHPIVFRQCFIPVKGPDYHGFITADCRLAC